MGLFTKKLSVLEQQQLEMGAESIQVLYKQIFNETDDLEVLVTQRKLLNEHLNNLISIQNKHSRLFKKDTPLQAFNQIKSELPTAEKKFINRYIQRIEKRLLHYKTQKGKTNNLNNSLEKFMYYSGEFLPESIDYFKEMIKIHFSVDL